MKIDAANIPAINFVEQASAPSTPTSGEWKAYFKAAGLYVIDDAGVETGPFGSGGGGATLPQTPPASPNAADDEFDDTTFDTGKWTRDTNFSSGSAPTVTQAQGAVLIKAAGATVNVYNQAISGSFKVRAHVRSARTDGIENVWEAYRTVGISVSYSTTKNIIFGMRFADGAYRLGVHKFNGATEVSSTYWVAAVGAAWFMSVSGYYLELEVDATTIYYRASLSGHDGTFIDLSSEAISTHLGTAPDKIGLGMFNYTNPGMILVDYFRRIS
jgi:hypothetical protein